MPGLASGTPGFWLRGLDFFSFHFPLLPEAAKSIPSFMQISIRCSAEESVGPPLGRFPQLDFKMGSLCYTGFRGIPGNRGKKNRAFWGPTAIPLVDFQMS